MTSRTPAAKDAPARNIPPGQKLRTPQEKKTNQLAQGTFQEHTPARRTNPGYMDGTAASAKKSDPEKKTASSTTRKTQVAAARPLQNKGGASRQKKTIGTQNAVDPETAQLVQQQQQKSEEEKQVVTVKGKGKKKAPPSKEEKAPAIDQEQAVQAPAQEEEISGEQKSSASSEEASKNPLSKEKIYDELISSCEQEKADLQAALSKLPSNSRKKEEIENQIKDLEKEIKKHQKEKATHEAAIKLREQLAEENRRLEAKLKQSSAKPLPVTQSKDKASDVDLAPLRETIEKEKQRRKKLREEVIARESSQPAPSTEKALWHLRQQQYQQTVQEAKANHLRALIEDLFGKLKSREEANPPEEEKISPIQNLEEAPLPPEPLRYLNIERLHGWLLKSEKREGPPSLEASEEELARLSPALFQNWDGLFLQGDVDPAQLRVVCGKLSEKSKERMKQAMLLTSSKMTDDGLEALHPFDLTHLWLDSFGQKTIQGIVRLLEKNKQHLQEIRLLGGNLVKDDSIPNILLQCLSVKTLDLSGSTVTREVLQALAGGMKALERLILNGTKIDQRFLTDGEILYLQVFSQRIEIIFDPQQLLIEDEPSEEDRQLEEELAKARLSSQSSLASAAYSDTQGSHSHRSTASDRASAASDEDDQGSNREPSPSHEQQTKSAEQNPMGARSSGESWITVSEQSGSSYEIVFPQNIPVVKSSASGDTDSAVQPSPEDDVLYSQEGTEERKINEQRLIRKGPTPPLRPQLQQGPTELTPSEQSSQGSEEQAAARADGREEDSSDGEPADREPSHNSPPSASETPRYASQGDFSNPNLQQPATAPQPLTDTGSAARTPQQQAQQTLTREGPQPPPRPQQKKTEEQTPQKPRSSNNSEEKPGNNLPLTGSDQNAQQLQPASQQPQQGQWPSSHAPPLTRKRHAQRANPQNIHLQASEEGDTDERKTSTQPRQKDRSTDSFPETPTYGGLDLTEEAAPEPPSDREYDFVERRNAARPASTARVVEIGPLEKDDSHEHKELGFAFKSPTSSSDGRSSTLHLPALDPTNSEEGDFFGSPEKSEDLKIPEFTAFIPESWAALVTSQMESPENYFGFREFAISNKLIQTEHAPPRITKELFLQLLPKDTGDLYDFYITKLETCGLDSTIISNRDPTEWEALWQAAFTTQQTIKLALGSLFSEDLSPYEMLLQFSQDKEMIKRFKTLDVSNKGLYRIATCFSRLPLGYLTLFNGTNNHFSRIPIFPRSSYLRDLILCNNNIEDLSGETILEYCARIRLLNLQQNEIKYLSSDFIKSCCLAKESLAQSKKEFFKKPTAEEPTAIKLTIEELQRLQDDFSKNLSLLIDLRGNPICNSLKDLQQFPVTITRKLPEEPSGVVLLFDASTFLRLLIDNYNEHLFPEAAEYLSGNKEVNLQKREITDCSLEFIKACCEMRRADQDPPIVLDLRKNPLKSLPEGLKSLPVVVAQERPFSSPIMVSILWGGFFKRQVPARVVLLVDDPALNRS